MFVNLLIYQVYVQSINEACKGNIIKFSNKRETDMVFIEHG